MENLDFGWDFAIMILLLYLPLYYLIAWVNYFLTVELGELIWKILKKHIGEEKNIFYTAVPFLIAATIIFWTLIKLYLMLFHEIPLFKEAFGYYFHGFTSYITGLTCLGLTRYSFTQDWHSIGLLNKTTRIRNFFLWTTILMILNFFLDLLFSFYMIYPALILIITYFFLKWRNINQPIMKKEKETVNETSIQPN